MQVVFGFGAARFCLALRRLLLCFSAGPLLLGRGGGGLASRRRLLLLLEADGVLVVVSLLRWMQRNLSATWLRLS